MKTLVLTALFALFSNGQLQADESNATPPLSFCVRVAPILGSGLAGRLKAGLKGEFDALIALQMRDIGIPIDRVTAVSGLLHKLENAADDQPPTVIVELKSEDDVRAFVNDRKLEEIKGNVEIADFPNTRMYRGHGVGFVISGKLIVPITHNPKKAEDILQPVAAALKYHPLIVSETTKLKSHLLVKVGPQVMSFLDKSGLPREAKDFISLVKATGYTLKASFDKSMTIDLAGTFPSSEAANAAKDSATAAITLLEIEQKALHQDAKHDERAAKFMTLPHDLLEQIRTGAKLVTDGKMLTVRAVVELPSDADNALALLAEKIIENRRKDAVASHFKEIMLAHYDYFDGSDNSFAGNSFDSNGKPLLSWRVHLLPHLKQNELYQQFKLDEPWDSEHNKKLIEKMPKIYSHPLVKQAEPGMTHFRGFAMKTNEKGIKAFLPFEPGEKGRRITDMPDGTANCISVVEAAEAVVRTKPEHLLYEPDGKLPKLGAGSKDGFQVGFADGSTRFMNNNVAEQVIRNFITLNGFEKHKRDR